MEGTKTKINKCNPIHVLPYIILEHTAQCLALQGQPLGIDIMYLVLADRNMQVRFGLKVVWGS